MKMIEKIKLGGRWVGEGYPCFITVDVGANHNRDLGRAKELIEMAAEAGTDAVKFQFYSAETLYSRKVPKHSYYKKHLWDLIKEIETPRMWIPELKAHCDRKNIIFFATPFDFSAVEELKPHVDFYKIASFELVDLPLIKYTAKKGKPVLISTGLADMKEVEDACTACREAGNENVILLQCASLYPAKPKIMNLRAMKAMEEAFGVPAGLSDHTPGVHISVAAAAMGAKVIEKHFTLSRALPGPDHPFAIEPEELKQLVRQVREVEAAFGEGKKQGPAPEERENYEIVRRSIHARVDIPRGTTICGDMLIVKRPGYGIKPKFIDTVINRKAKCDIEKDQWITWEAI